MAFYKTQIIIPVIFFLLLVSTDIFPQDFKGGIIGGITTSQVAGDELAGFDKPGLIFGGAVARYFTKRLSAQMQLVYFQKGSRKVKRPDKYDFDFYKLKLDYIDVPLVLRYKAYKNFVAEGGISFGTLIYSSEEDETGILPGRPPFKRFDFSVAGGVSYPATDHIVINWKIFNSVLPIRGQVKYLAAYERITGGQYNTVMIIGAEYRFGKK